MFVTFVHNLTDPRMAWQYPEKIGVLGYSSRNSVAVQLRTTKPCVMNSNPYVMLEESLAPLWKIVRIFQIGLYIYNSKLLLLYLIIY